MTQVYNTSVTLLKKSVKPFSRYKVYDGPVQHCTHLIPKVQTQIEL